MKLSTMTLAAVLMVLAAYACATGHAAEVPPPTVPENGEVVRTYLGVNVYKTEWPCARQGGLCVHKADCRSPTTKSGLCPESAHRGVECCYEVQPPNNLPCRQYIGRCEEWCHPAMRVPAGDCNTAAGTVCCVQELL